MMLCHTPKLTIPINVWIMKINIIIFIKGITYFFFHMKTMKDT